MSGRNDIVSGLTIALTVTGIAAVAGVVIVALTWWLPSPGSGAKPAAPPVPAWVPKTLKEDQINTVVLSPDAVQRLALETAQIEKKPMPATRFYGGEVVVPAGQSVIVAAPLSGRLKAPASGVPQPGAVVKRGQPIFQILPLLTPEGRVNLIAAKIEADGQARSTQTQLEAAQIALDRANKLLMSEAGSKRMVDEAQAQFELAKKLAEAASARRDMLGKAVGELDQGTAAPLTLEAPETGVLRNVSALPDQNVPSGATLFEVITLDRMWVRIPVYVGDLRTLDTGKDVALGNLAASGSDMLLPAKPVLAPPAANPLAGTVDLIFEFDNRKSQFRPGQRVGVQVPQIGEAESLTVPWSAVIHDIHGGTWVYEQTGERTYNRKRVAVRAVRGPTAVLSAGPAAGSTVVTAGAAELFGTETGFSK